MRKLKLLISANSCEPDKESEPCAAVRKIDPSPFLSQAYFIGTR